jgi:hypothetical protein
MTGSGDKFMDGTAAGSSTDNTYGWYLYNYVGTRSAQFDTSTKYSGKGSLKLTTNAGSLGVALQANVDNHFSWAINGLQCEPNTLYSVSVWIKTNLISGSATTGVQVTVSEKNKTGANVAGGRTLATGIITTQDWTQYTSTFTTTGSTKFLSPSMQITGNNGAATLNIEAWFDDISIIKSPVQTRTANTFPQRKTPDNLLSNGNFEYAPPFTAATTTNTRWIDGTAGGSNSSDAYGWFAGVTAGTFSAQFDTSEKYSGTSSMKLTTSAGGWTELTTTHFSTRRRLIPVLPSTSYTLAGWIKTQYISGSGATGARLGVNTYNGATTYIATPAFTTAISTTTHWTYFTSTFTTTSDARFATALLSIRGNDGAGTLAMTAWFDDITLTKVPADARTVVS